MDPSGPNASAIMGPFPLFAHPMFPVPPHSMDLVDPYTPDEPGVQPWRSVLVSVTLLLISLSSPRIPLVGPGVMGSETLLLAWSCLARICWLPDLT